MTKDDGKLGFNAAWSMAVGGMIGGGIFSVLGVVYSLAGRLSWLSFLIGGAIAFLTGHSYSRIAARQKEAGGAYAFLRSAGHQTVAANLAVLLILGYALTLSVYAYTFGAYVADVLGAASWIRPALSVAVLVAIAGLNLMGVGEASLAEEVLVWGKLAVLAVIAAIGIAAWNPQQMEPSDFSAGWTAPLIAAAVIFMAYEGFQLLTYDYDELRDPRRLLPKAMLGAIVTVILVYIAIALGAAMLVGADTLIEQKETALAAAGRAALGRPGLYLTVAAAAFSTASAINATMFATARLAHRAALKGDLPATLRKTNGEGIPIVGVLGLTALALTLVVLGNLSSLVESASLLFLATFAVVNGLAWKQRVTPRWMPVAGFAGCSAATLALLARSVELRPIATAGLAGIAAAIIVARHALRGKKAS